MICVWQRSLSSSDRSAMGSLFDGIGGFPLAAIRNDVTPVWASEIEAFPIEVTKERFPDMIHVGDITKLNGAALPPVDIICGGSPCQDLSVAGARAGLAGARSGLFMSDKLLTEGNTAASIDELYLFLTNLTAIEYIRNFMTCYYLVSTLCRSLLHGSVD